MRIDMNMDCKEAVHIMTYSRLSSEHFTPEGLCGAYVAALAALMVQIPRKAEKSDSGEYYICPCCERYR